MFQFSVSCVSILAGILSDCVAEWLGRGYSAPYIIALLPIFYATFIIIKCYYVGFIETFQSIYYNRRFSLLFSSILQSLIDCTIYVFIFSWTPLLEYSAKHTSSIGLVYFPLGAIFSCFMAGIMIGGLLFKIFRSYSVSPTKVLIIISLSIAALNFLLSNYSPIHEKINPQSCLVILVCIEILYGMYTPYIQWLRQNCTPIDFANNNFSMYVVDCAVRIPMNLIIIFFIFIPLMPKQLDLEPESINSATSQLYRFHFMNPANLFLASSLLALLSIIPGKILHNVLPRDSAPFARSTFITIGSSI
ncbi:hypothetical protein MXB_4742 [Myxobolus squamalis]|nr:hypothetical protein MXB_4742 [Myxobolus squamalis]